MVEIAQVASQASAPYGFVGESNEIRARTADSSSRDQFFMKISWMLNKFQLAGPYESL